VDYVEFLRPKYLLMENVMGIVSSSLEEGEITPWLIAKLVSLNYQSRMGILQAGNYGNF